MKNLKLLGNCLVLLVFAAVGCSGNQGPQTIPVHGIVTLDGKPLEGATVSFIPKAEGQPGTGLTDAAGQFVLSTYAFQDGAVPGTHTVLVSKTAYAPNTSATTATARANEIPPLDDRMPPKSLMPLHYSDPTKSGLSADVKPGMEPVNFDLHSR